MPYRHIDIECQQVSKKPGNPCGDAFMCKRTVYHTTLICADGVGSGIKAHVASQMNAARLNELLAGGVSLRDAFFSVADTMSRWRDGAMPFMAFSLARILNDGSATVLAYEMPPPIFLSKKTRVLEASALVVRAGVASEYHCRLDKGDGLVLMSDGIVQSGMGSAYAMGWGIQGVEAFLSDWRAGGRPFYHVIRGLLRQAQENDGAVQGDDKTVVAAHCREGKMVQLFTGPASERSRDMELVNDFLNGEWIKVVCGATTADIVARYAQEKLEVEQNPFSFSTPPRYFIKGIDLVTEGAVTLNQVYNILGEDLEHDSDRSAAADLALLLKSADRIDFTLGTAQNPANKDLSYRKQGILSREKIIPLIAAKLEQMNKLVSINTV